MNNTEIIILIMEAIGVLVLLIGILLIYMLLHKNDDKSKTYQTEEEQKVFVNKGVDVKKNTLGSGKGEFFSGNLSKKGTYVMGNPDYLVWKLSLYDMRTGTVYRKQFNRQIWIGRIDGDGQEARLKVPGDNKISKTHCIVFVTEERLCLADSNSTNHTFLNGRQVEQPVFLENGDILRIGDTELKVEYGR